MKNWYERYESQCWYENTFLVNDFRQIARVIEKDREWNNIKDSGCNFTCIAMILGINPAQLASEIRKQDPSFFQADRTLKTKKLNGDGGFLVWDKNAPNEQHSKLSLSNIIHPTKGKTDLNLRFVKIEKTSDIEQAKDIIKNAKKNGLEIICGYDDHSRLVAGEKAGTYFLWDPDTIETDWQKNINGEYTIEWFFHEYNKLDEYKNKKAEFWHYSLD